MAMTRGRDRNLHFRFPAWWTQAARCVLMAGQSRVLPIGLVERRFPYFSPSFFPAESSRIDSRMRFSRVPGRFAVWIQVTKSRR